MPTKEQLMDLAIRTYGFEDLFTIEFCRECEKEDSNIAELLFILAIKKGMEE